MSVDKSKRELISIEGKAVRKMFAEHSKSEHLAIYIETSTHSYVLRLKGENPFNSEKLNKLVGKKIIATGLVKDYSFFADTIEEIG